MPVSAHPLPDLPGWESLPSVEPDGKNWTVPFAAKYLDIPEILLRETIRYTGLQPSGTLNMREFRSQGRAARAYSAAHLITIAEGLQALKENF